MSALKKRDFALLLSHSSLPVVYLFTLLVFNLSAFQPSHLILLSFFLPIFISFIPFAYISLRLEFKRN